MSEERLFQFFNLIERSYFWIFGLQLGLFGCTWYAADLSIEKNGFWELPSNFRVALAFIALSAVAAIWTKLAIAGSLRRSSEQDNNYSNVKIPFAFLLMLLVGEAVALAFYFL